MAADSPSESPLSTLTFTAADVAAILAERGWISCDSELSENDAFSAWCARAAELLSPHAGDRAKLGELLALVFQYDAVSLMSEAASQAVMAREGSRDIIRELANRVLDGGEIDSDGFKEIIDSMKAAVPYRSRELFHPIRLALAGRAGEGELDRVILLVDAAAKTGFALPVKGTRQRMIEFCAAMD
jgi:hypothetical protein